ncbi:1,2-phenylacetyl-CoA epoxidase subunit PaaD [Maritalea sp.]|uniref:1,2-phenylacetyl-CoA epoxidase subunit PaaD n=1 Tax=Maritalea sp. TaxID=2003361 RepID=UPI003EF4B310
MKKPHTNEATRDPLAQRAWDAAALVPDPEVPCVNVAELGILRDVKMIDGQAVAYVTPTYTGCPAVLAIELAIDVALREAGFDPKIERVISPAWTTDWISEVGREKLRAYGIAPPVNGSNSKLALFGQTIVACPKCGSSETEKLSEFGSTACKAHYRCKDCLEPFDYFKCI